MLSICFIMKNEEKHLTNFLDAIVSNFKDISYELVGVDTGSEDRSIDIFNEYSLKHSSVSSPWHLYHFTWCQDFSAARNFMLSKCTCDYVLILDVDEYLTKINADELFSFISNRSTDVGLISRANHFESNGSDSIYVDAVERFFDKRLYHYEGIIHEQVRTIKGGGYESVPVKVCVDHQGYSGSNEEMLAKAQRNIHLLKIELKMRKDDPYIWFQLGQAYNSIHDDENAYYYYGKGLELDVDPSMEYVKMMVTAYGYCMLHLGMESDALALEGIYDEFSGTAEFVCLMGLIYLRNGMLVKAMGEFLKATTFETVSTKGANSFIPLYNMGCINELLGDIPHAIALYKQCGDFVPAAERLKELKSLS